MFRGLLGSIRDAVDRVRDFVEDVTDRITGRSEEPIDDLSTESEETQADLDLTSMDIDQAEEELEADIEEGEDEGDEDDDLDEAIEDLESAQEELTEALEELANAQDEATTQDLEELARDAIAANKTEDEFVADLEDLDLDTELIEEARIVFQDQELAEPEEQEPVDIDDEIESAYEEGLDEDDFYTYAIDDLHLSPDQASAALDRYVEYQIERYNEDLEDAQEQARESADIGEDVYDLVERLAAEGYTQGQIAAAFDAYFEETAVQGTATPYEESGAFNEDELDEDDNYRKTVGSLEEAQEWTAAVPTGKFVRRIDEDGNEWFDLYAKETTV